MLDVDLYKRPEEYDNLVYGLMEISGDVVHDNSEYISCTNRIKLVRKMTRQELLDCIEDGELITRNGDRFWFRNHMYHREGDEPAIIRTIGTKEWYKDGKLHRTGDKPAMIDRSCRKECRRYYIDGHLHREHGRPAVEYSDERRNEYYLHGESYQPQ